MFFILVAVMSFGGHAREEAKKGRAVVAAAADPAGGDAAAGKKRVVKMKLTIPVIIDQLFKSGHGVKRVLIDYKGTDSNLMLLESKYNTYLFGTANYSHAESNNPSEKVFSGDRTDRMVAAVGVQKGFSTGTTLSASVTGMYQNAMGAGITTTDPTFYYMFKSMGGKLYRTGINVELTQDLLKNAFGIQDRNLELKLKNYTGMSRTALRMKLSGVVMEAVVAYWNIAISDEVLKTTQMIVKSTGDIRNLIERKLGYGLAEREDSLDWNGKFLMSKNGEENAKKMVYDARLNLLRMINADLGPDDVEIEAQFVTTPPSVTREQAITDAFIKRADWNIQKSMLKNAELEYSMAQNDLDPTLKLKVGAGNVDYSKKSYPDTWNSLKKQFSVGLEMTYPLENTAAKIRMRDARLGLKKEKLNTEQLERQIRDELSSIVRQCEVDYTVYTQTKKSREYTQGYYNQVLAKFGQGRMSSLQLKLALDGFAQARLAELQSLITYNITLLRRDLARNVIFDNFKIDVDSMLKNMEKEK